MQVAARGLTFEVHVGGPAGGRPVLLLHGFPQDHREFDLILPRLHAAGLRTISFDQRGYDPGARPAGVAAYRLSEAVSDATAVLDALKVERAHVIGHDWGAQVAWILASEKPDRVASLTAISVPHPRALATALKTRPSQRARFAYMGLFRSPIAEKVLMAGNATILRSLLRPIRDRAGLYVDAMREPGRLTGALNWYRALARSEFAGVGKIEVPTTYVWSDKDPVVGLTAALRTAVWVDADYQLVALKGIGHWVPEEAPAALADAALARIGDKD